MQILIVNTNRLRNPFPVVPLGACIVAEAARAAGYEVAFLDLLLARRPERALERGIEWTKPDVVGFSVRNIDNNNMRQPSWFAGDLRALVAVARARPGVTTVLGGSAVAVMPEELLRETGASWAVLGEGETALPRLLEALAGGADPRRVDGVAWIEDGVFRRNDVRRPELEARFLAPRFRQWIRLHTYTNYLCTVPLQTKRGCPFECIYCTYPLCEGREYRLADPALVADALERLAADGVRDVEFVDNVFNAPYEHAYEICSHAARARTGVRLTSIDCNPRFLDRALLAMMVRAGFAGIGVTVESASDEVLARLKKGYGADAVFRAAEAVRTGPLPCLWLFLLGGPGETHESVRETLAFARERIRPTDVALFTVGIRVYPRTEMERVARAEGLLDGRSDGLLRPCFYLSPAVDPACIRKELAAAVAANPNHIGPDSFDLPFLPELHRLAASVGVRQPAWRFTRRVRRWFPFLGKEH